MRFFFSPSPVLMKVRRESHLSLCDNLSPSSVISVLAPLILIVLYNCGDADLAVFEALACSFHYYLMP